ncbi:MAG TPA: ABC transporter permease [Acidobacteriota bacterium]|nr:ABC transporter permease [Acidobacteriota bacterium]
MMLDGLWSDLRLAWKTLKRKPLASVVVVATLALAIGGGSAVFSVVEGVVLRPLPYHEPERLVGVWQLQRHDAGQNSMSLPNFLDWQEQSETFAELAAFKGSSLVLSYEGRTERVMGVESTAEFFSVFGVDPLHGRTFLPDEDGPAGRRVIVLSHAFFSSRFGGDSAIVGQSLTLNGRAYEVIGVMPPEFRTPDYPNAQFWEPIREDAESSCGRGCLIYRSVGRLADNVSMSQASAELNTISRRLEEAHPEDNAGVGAMLVDLHQQTVGDVRPILSLLVAAVGLLLLIACANVTNILSAQAAVRRSEAAMLQALGASSGRLMRRLLLEGLLLAGVGGALGLLMSFLGLDALLALAPEELPRLDQITLNAPVVLFSLLVTAATGILFSLLPAFQLKRQQPAQVLSSSGRTHSGGGGGYSRQALVLVQVAMAVPLLIACGLLLRSFWTLAAAEVGFQSERLLAARVYLAGERYETDRQPRLDFFRRLLEEVRSQPGVRAASTVWIPPLTDNAVITSFTIQGRPEPPPGQHPGAEMRVVGDRYFSTVGIPLLKGRAFDDTDLPESQKVAVISKAMADRHWPDSDPLGQFVELGLSFAGDHEGQYHQIVGVVGDVKLRGLAVPERATVYLPYSQNAPTVMSLMMRYDGDSGPLVESVRKAVADLDPNLAVYDIRSMSESRARGLVEPRFYALMLGYFAVVAALLAVLGVYGVAAYQTASRTREIGIRMALGARRGQVLQAVMRSGLGPVALGLLLGTVVAFSLSNLLMGLLHGVDPLDRLTFASASSLLLLAAVGAVYLPARRASRIDPSISLRWQ